LLSSGPNLIVLDLTKRIGASMRTSSSLLRISCFLLLLISTSNVFAQHKAEWSKGDHAKTIPLRDMTPIIPEEEGHRDKPIRLLVPAAPTGLPDTALQTAAVAAVTVGNVTSFDGVGQGAFGFTVNSAPPDTNGAVGATQYVQWVNESFAVFSKAGALLAGPTAGNTLFQALGATHPCAVHNDGDPIAQYDKAAGRWVLTQFSVTSGATQGFWQCVAVSATGDATGAYNVYAFNYGTVQFNDYPKLGVWNNSYLITFNIFNNGSTFAGSKLCALDRASMIAGTAATQICFQLTNAFGGVLPSDIDGLTPPPAGSPGYFLNFGTNSLNLWQLSNINFTAGTATLTGPANLPVAAFAAACAGGTCIPQSGTNQKLDSLADRLMYRLAYRNFGDHEALVVNHSVTAGTSTGVRWYEIRSPGTTPTVFQQGTFAPDASFRWMGSAAMDHVGNIAVGYSVSSTALNPAIRFTGRAPTDPLGTLGTELSIQTGTGSQLTGLSRWGDYSSISVDPTDDCTMWYTTEYLKTNGTFNWSTRIANFKFAGCTLAPDFSLAATPASQTATAGNPASYTATVSPSGGYTGTVSFSVAGLPNGATATFTPATVTTSGTTTMAVATTASVAAGSYPLTITGTDGTLTHTASVTLVVTAPIVGDFAISAAPASQSVAAGASTSYTTTITPSGGFTDTVALSASGLPTGASATFVPSAVAGGSGSSSLNVTTSTTTPAGTYTITITGTDAGLVHSTTVTLVVTAPANFTFTATPASVTISRGGTATYTVTVGAQNGFTGTVNLTVAGLPQRVTATFTPTTVTGSGTSTLRVVSANNSQRGTSTLTITGASGTITHTATVTLVIQ
jgi:hypothetical protein